MKKHLTIRFVYLKFLLLILTSVILTNCKKNKDNDDELYAEISFIMPFKASSEQVNFKNETIHFTGETNVIARWQLELRGMTSNATYIINGRSKIFDSYNTLWDGSSNNFPSFQSENVVATLSYPNRPTYVEPVRDTIFISERKNLDTSAIDTRVITHCNTVNTAHWIPFGWWPISIQNTLNSPVGNPYFRFQGQPIAVNHLFAGGFAIPAQHAYAPPATSNGGYYYNLPNDPENVFFNISVYNTGKRNTNLEIYFKQDDDDDGEFTESEENAYSYQINLNQLDWPENIWRLFSVPYSELKHSTDPQYGGAGDTIMRPHRIVQIDFVFLANNATTVIPNDLEIAFDMPIFTIGRPYRP